MLVHDLRHPLSSLGLIAEVLEAEDLSAAERHTSVAADPQHVHRHGAAGRRRARGEPARGGGVLGRAAADDGARGRRADARGLHARRHATAGRAGVRRLARPRAARRSAEAPAGDRQPRRQRAQVHAQGRHGCGVRVWRDGARATAPSSRSPTRARASPRPSAPPSSTATSRGRGGGPPGGAGWAWPSREASPRRTAAPSP